MEVIKQQKKHEEPDITLLQEYLPKLNVETRAYIKGAVKALVYAQENNDSEQKGDNLCVLCKK